MDGSAQKASALAGSAPKEAHFRSPRVIAIGGGRDICGKSLTSASLALAFAKRGQRVVLVDCAKGYQAPHELLGIDLPPRESVTSVRGSLSLRHLIFPTPIDRLQILPAYSHYFEAGGLSSLSIAEFARKLRYLPADVVILDAGHGAHGYEIDLFNSADQRLIVTTSQFLSIQFGFAFVKKTIRRLIQTTATTETEVEAWALVSTQTGGGSTTHLLKGVAAASPEWFKNVQARIQNYHAHLVGNLLMDEREENVLHAVARMIKHHVKLTVPVTGSIRANQQVYHAVAQDQPLLRLSQEMKHQGTIEHIITELLRAPVVLPQLPRDPNAEFIEMFGEGADFEGDPSLRQETGVETAVTVSRGQDQAGQDAARIADSESSEGGAVSFTSYQRQKERLALKMKVTVHWLGDAHEGEMLELSETGTSIDVRITLQENSRVDVYFEAEPDKRYVLEVRNVRSASTYGFQFVGETIPAPKLAAWHAVFPR